MYAVLADLVEALGEDTLLALADRDGDDQIDAAVVAGALNAASAEIDSAVAARYRLPMDPVPARLKFIALDLAHYALDRNPNDDLRKRVDDARKALRDIRDGKDTLGDAALAGTGDEPEEDSASANLPAHKTFTSQTDMGGF
ncbi:MAG: gp436 family protein [Alphaproteobacteria bacterium]